VSRFAILALSGAVGLGGCTTPSLHPLVSENTEIAVPALVGVWSGEDEGEVIEISALQPGPGYGLVTQPPGDDEQPVALEVRAVSIGEHRFLDVTHIGDPVLMPLVFPAHVFIKFQVDDTTLTVWQMTDDWHKIEHLARQAKVERVRNRNGLRDFTIMTASTAELQRFVATHADDARVFSAKSDVYTRQPHGEAANPDPGKP